jgi:pilus assembly protein Flp/PilA
MKEVMRLASLLKSLKRDGRRGQSMVEYALILVLVAVVVVTVLTSLGSQITAVFSRVAGALGR